MRLSELQSQRKLKRCNVPDYGMKWLCPDCGSTELDVNYTRAKSNGIYRKRVCTCGASFETFEKITKIHKSKG